MIDKRIIVALDVPNSAAALEQASRLDSGLCRVKVGKELHTAAGPQIIDALMARGFDVFLDLKFHDIPNTVAAACRVAASQGVWMVNVHASGGRRMLDAAREAVDAANGKKPLLIAVTVLTSMGDADIDEIGLAGPVDAAVLRLARLSAQSGLDGVVCSAAEAHRLKSALGANFVTVTPGIRLAGDAAGDQVRVLTPEDAVRQGADYLVIGRSISAAADPVATLQRIHQQLEALETNA